MLLMPSAPSSKPSVAPWSEYLRQVASLNERQSDALNEPGHTVVLAGPGSGKTKTLVLKIARLLDQIPQPQGLACLTYGQEAAREFESRLRELGIRSSGRLFTGTVHAFCLSNVLRPFGHRLPPEQRYLAEYELANDFERGKAREAGLAASGINEPETWWSAKLDEFRRLTMVEPERASEGRFDVRLPRCAQVYADTLHAARRIDFDDIVAGSFHLIEHDAYIRAFLAAKYPYFVIDEYQDLGLALHRMVLALMDRAGAKVFVVGDPDQSIYGFSGARPEFLEAFGERADVRTIQLELNYRCRQEIIDASLHVLQPAEERLFRSSGAEKGELFFHASKGGLAEQAAVAVQRIDELVSAGLPPGEIGILASRWDDLAEFETQLEARHIPYRMQRSAPYKATPLTAWIEDVARWCAGGWQHGTPKLRDLFGQRRQFLAKLYGRSGPSADLAQLVEFHGVLLPLRGPDSSLGEWLPKVIDALQLATVIGGTTTIPLALRYDVDELRTLVRALTSAPQSAQLLGEFAGVARNKVVLQSLHGSKGLQYTVVFLPALESGVLPRYKGDEAEARRLFYVGLTRARQEVHLLCSGFYFGANGRKLEYGPSPFVKELWKRLHPSKP
jgi:DNA helicase-2/ATP-dependent DNA helicase PcrA